MLAATVADAEKSFHLTGGGQTPKESLEARITNEKARSGRSADIRALENFRREGKKTKKIRPHC